MLEFFELFLLFIVYSFFGYIIEMIWCSIETKKFLNRGFLMGPVIPIFGVGAVLITLLLTRYYDDPIVVFVFAMILTTTLEYIVGYLLEKIFHNKWWDYSKMFGNLHGRICILNTLSFGVGAIFIIYLANPLIMDVRILMSDMLVIIIGAIVLLLFIADSIYSFIVAYNLRTNIIVVEELKNRKLSDVTKFLEEQLISRMKKFKPNPDRLIKSFPKLKEGMAKEFDIITSIRKKLKFQTKEEKKRRKEER